jgi:predicted XRE-type DNA-binding protein
MAKKSQKNKPEEIEFTMGSGNVYADFGFANPEEAKTKAELSMLIAGIIKEKGLTQQQAADLMKIDQPKVSKIVRGLLSEFSIERLLKFVLSLGFDIEITPKPHKVKTSPPCIHVAAKSYIQPRLTA